MPLCAISRTEADETVFYDKLIKITGLDKYEDCKPGRGKPRKKIGIVHQDGTRIDFFALYGAVKKAGGYDIVRTAPKRSGAWKKIATQMDNTWKSEAAAGSKCHNYWKKHKLSEA